MDKETKRDATRQVLVIPLLRSCSIFRDLGDRAAEVWRKGPSSYSGWGSQISIIEYVMYFNVFYVYTCITFMGIRLYMYMIVYV